MATTENKAKPFGVCVAVRESDPFANLVGTDWSTTHWFQSEAERDRELRDMAREHEYSRRGDKPTLIFTTVNRTTET